MNNQQLEIETHPWPPFIPDGAQLLIMGTFPPGQKRWSMEFFYPNPINDFWRIMGMIYFGNKEALYIPEQKKFDVDKIKPMLIEHHIGMGDTVHKAKRLMGNASDKFLEIVEPMPLFATLEQHPTIKALATTGEKAASVVAELTQTKVPKMGEYEVSDTGLQIWRMPSTSRAYPMKIDKKMEFYLSMLKSLKLA